MGAPDEVTTVGAVLTAPDGNPAFGVIVCHCGSPSEGEDALKPLRSFSTPLADTIQSRAYVDMQTLLDDIWPPGRHYYDKAHNIRSLSDDAIRVILEYGNALPTPVSNIAFQQLHGAASRVGSSETAFPHRYDHYNLMAHPATEDPTQSEAMIRWAQKCWEALQPFVERALYVNALEDADEEGRNRVREAYGPNYARLLSLKNQYDPTNLSAERKHPSRKGRGLVLVVADLSDGPDQMFGFTRSPAVELLETLRAPGRFLLHEVRLVETPAGILEHASARA